MAIVTIAGHEFLLDDDRMAKTPRGVPKLDHAEAAVTIVNAENRDALEAELGVDVAGERVALHAIVLERGEIPRDDCLGNGGISGGAVDHGNFGFQIHAKADVRGVAAERSVHGPDFFVVGHLDDLVTGGSPRCGVVVNHEAKRLAAVSASGVGLVDGQVDPIQHFLAEYVVGMIVDRTEKSDAYFGNGRRIWIGDVARRAVVFDESGVILVVRRGELRVRTQIFRGFSVWAHLTVFGMAGRILSTRAAEAG